MFQEKDIKIVKRDGSTVSFDVSKINMVIDWANSNLDVDVGILKEKIGLFIHDGISTHSIQELLVNNALSFASIDQPDWRFIAARLLLLDIYKTARITQGYTQFGYGDYVDFVKKAVSEGLYDEEILRIYSEDELREIAEEIEPDYDLGFDYAGMSMLKDRYLTKLNGRVFELPQQMYMTIALWMASVESKSVRLDYAKQFYHAIGNRILSPATPILLNLRKKGGNLASCFITAVDDSLDSIMYTLDQAAQISKNAGGVGVNLSRIRSHGATIRNIKGASGGVMGWIKLFNDVSVSVNQLGSRAGAITVALDIWHRDIEDFLELQTENGDQRTKSFDVFPQIVVNDLFIQHYQEGNIDWHLFDPHEVKKIMNYDLAALWGDAFGQAYYDCVQAYEEGRLKLVKVIKPNKLVKEALIVAMETGMPYWCNKDTINRANPNKHSGMIGSANLCVESFSNFEPSVPHKKYNVLEDDMETLKQIIDPGYVHTCNLLSPNASKIEDSKIEYYARLSTRMLDNLLDVGEPPIPESQMHNDDYRILGIGSLGIHDRCVKDGIKYSEAKDYMSKYFEKFAYYCIDESSNLARDRGSYKYFEGSDWEQGIFFGRSSEVIQDESLQTGNNLDWNSLAEKVRKKGMRNGGLLAIAPNTSTSLVLGCSASVLPIYDKFYIDKNSVGTFVQSAQFLNDETFWLYEENKNIDQNKVIENVAEIQKWTDQGISMELIINLDLGIDAPAIRDMYMNAMNSGCKTVYYLRTKTKGNGEGCSSCAN